MPIRGRSWCKHGTGKTPIDEVLIETTFPIVNEHDDNGRIDALSTNLVKVSDALMGISVEETSFTAI